MKVGLVSSYPPVGAKYAAGERALSWYTANLISVLPTGDLDYEVYANKLPGQLPSCKIGEHTEIIRCWTPGIFSVSQVVSQIVKSRPDLVHVQHEIFQFGKGLAAVPVSLLFLVLKAMRIPTVVTLHSVPPLSKIDRSFMSKYGRRVLPSLVKIAFWLVIWPIVALADRVVVHAASFAQTLGKEYRLSRQMKKVEVIPLGIEAGADRINSEEAKIRLGLHDKQVILFFGNLTAYKGLELLVDGMRALDKMHHDLALIIAGGDTPGLQVAGRQAYSEALKERARCTSPNIQFTGFVEESNVSTYFAAADLVVLPYTIGLSSSGPLALAIAYDRPFVVSTALASVVDLDGAIFEPTVQSLVEKIDRFLSNGDLRREIMEYGLKLRMERSWPRVGERTGQVYRNAVEGMKCQSGK